MSAMNDASNKRPNIVLMVSDQQRWDTLGCLGFEHAVTPHIDRLAERGVCFSRTYAQGAVCGPSRASLVSSKYVHSHGVEENGLWLRDGEPNFIEALRDAGYHTANIGKMHTQPTRIDCGFDYRFVVENKNHQPEMGGTDDYERLLDAHGLKRPGTHYHLWHDDWHTAMFNTAVWPHDEDLFPDNVVGRMSVDYIAEHDFRDRPLFLWSGFPGPHDPYDATESALERYGDRPIPEPIGAEGEAANKPPEHAAYMQWMETFDNAAAVRWTQKTPEKLDRLRRHYHANVMLIDDWVGRIVEAIDARGELDNTIFIFASDHGDALGDHEMIYKFATHYDSVVRVPFVWAGPGVATQGVHDALVELFDLGPTLLDIAGIEKPSQMQGRSLRPLLDGRAASYKDAVFSEHQHRIMIRTDRWKLVRYVGKAYGELYDMHADPEELRNLFEDGEHAGTRSELTGRLFDWYAAHRCRLLG